MKEKKYIEYGLICYFTLMCFDVFSKYYIDAMVLVTINLFIIIEIVFYTKKINFYKEDFRRYFILLGVFILLIGSMFITTENKTLILIRVLRLGSFIQLYFLYSIRRKSLKYQFIVSRFLQISYYISIVIFLDFILFNIIGISLWKPENYIGMRYSGPFQDSNYMSIYFAINFIILKYSEIKFEKKKKFQLVSILMIFLGKSWSAIIILVVSILAVNFIRFKNMFLKIVIIGGGYIAFIYAISKNYFVFKSKVLEFFSLIGMNEEILNLKFYSLEKRFNVQFYVLDVVKSEPLGAGPRGIYNVLELDSHNSYFSILGDLGVLGVIFLFATMYIINIQYSKFLDILTTFILLQCLFIDLLFFPIYWFMIFLLLNNNECERRTQE